MPPTAAPPILCRAARVSLGLTLAMALCVGLTGCVHRRLTIQSTPPGAFVYVDGYPVGTTPVSTEFIYYGTREIRLVKDGYQTLTVRQFIPPPWYEIPPLDFFSENFAFGEIRDNRIASYQLTPQIVEPTQTILDRAEQLRRGIRVEGVAPPSALVPPGSRASPAVSAPASNPAVNPGGAAIPSAQPAGSMPGTLQPGWQPPAP